MSRKHRRKASVSGSKEALRDKLSTPKKLEVETKAAPAEKSEKSEKGKRKRVPHIPLSRLNATDHAAYKERAYCGTRAPKRDIGITKREKVPENAYEWLKELETHFPHAVFTTADLYNGGTTHRVFQPGTDLMARFVVDPQFSTGIGVGNPMWKGTKRTNSVGLMEYVEEVVPQRNKLEQYRFFTANSKNFHGVSRFLNDAGFKKQKDA